jgi:hypothetical protein
VNVTCDTSAVKRNGRPEFGPCSHPPQRSSILRDFSPSGRGTTRQPSARRLPAADRPRGDHQGGADATSTDEVRERRAATPSGTDDRGKERHGRSRSAPAKRAPGAAQLRRSRLVLRESACDLPPALISSRKRQQWTRDVSGAVSPGRPSLLCIHASAVLRGHEADSVLSEEDAVSGRGGATRPPWPPAQAGPGRTPY